MNRAERLKVGRIQSLLGGAHADHGNDRDPNGFEKGQDAIKEAFEICIDLLGKYPPEDMPQD